MFLPKKDEKGAYEPIPSDDQPEDFPLTVAGPSNNSSAPPTFDEATEQAPDLPGFTAYEPDYFIGSQGYVISHDPHLNEDGEALYRFLLSQANVPPKLFLNCSGSHTEWRTRQVTRTENGRQITSTENYSETVVDFDFTIDASSYILANSGGSSIWIASDHEAAYRGKMVREVDNKLHVEEEGMDVESALVQHTLGTIQPTMGILERWKHGRRKATRREREYSSEWRERHHKWGIPPWELIRGQKTGTQAAIESDQLRLQSQPSGGSDTLPSYTREVGDSQLLTPSKTLRGWADEYCASNKILKEFTFEKYIYGWNLDSLQNAVVRAIQATHYQHQPKVTWGLSASTVTIMPDTRLSRVLSSKWMQFFLWITLIFPLIIWPFKRFHSRGGGEWRVAGSAFALSKWVHLQDSIPGESVDEYSLRTGLPHQSPASRPRILKATSNGISEQEGTREGEWFSAWEDTIMRLVTSRTRTSDPIRYPVGTVQTAGIGLDGYYRG